MYQFLLSSLLVLFWILFVVDLLFVGIFLTGYLNFRHDPLAYRDGHYAAFHAVIAFLCVVFIYLMTNGN